MNEIDTFVLSWDCHGLEACVNATELDQQKIMNILSDKDNKSSENINQIINILELRARANMQRNYEIYAIDVHRGITTKDIITAFEDNPQGMADIVRERGRKLYSDRRDTNKIKIV